jgi:hypothetical protein
MTTNFAKGIYTYKPNDTMGLDELRLAQDARFDRVGEYGTRLGYKKLSTPIGNTLYHESDSGSNIRAISDLQPYTFTATSNATIFSILVQCNRGSAAANEHLSVRLRLYANDVLIGTSYFQPPKSGESPVTVVYFNNAPEVKAGDTVKITMDMAAGNGAYVNARTQANSGAGLTIPAYLIYSCTPGQVTNIFEANINGNRCVLFTFNGTLYWQNSSGSVASIRALPAGVTKVRFCQNLNEVRYADGKEKPHKLVPTVGNGVVTGWTDSVIDVRDLKTGTAMDVNASNIMNGSSDNLMYFASDPDTEAFWTYPYGYTYAKSPSYSTTATISGAVGTTLTIQLTTISPSGIAVGDWITGQGTATAEVTSISGNNVNLRIVDTTPQTISSYDKFSTDFYQNFPAIKTGDPLTAMFNLGGVIYMMTRRNKYQMFTQTAESWSQNASNAQNGTFSQESVVCDLNYAYFANESGIYIFDGSSEASITESTIQNVYDSIPDKEKIVLDLYKNRLYVYYASTAGGPNDSCLVYNINLRVWESFDSNTYVSATSARQNSSGRFICGHSKIGMLMLNEDATNNDYSDMGQAIAFNLETSYQHFGSTSQLKRITKWRPEFASTTKPYTCECGYALDFSDQVQYAFSIDLQRNDVVYTDYVWDNPSDYGVPAIPTIHTTIPQVNGEFYRCQIRYQHIAAFEPVIFRSHTLTIQTQRIR